MYGQQGWTHGWQQVLQVHDEQDRLAADDRLLHGKERPQLLAGLLHQRAQHRVLSALIDVLPHIQHRPDMLCAPLVKRLHT